MFESARNFASMFSVSIKTIYRDIAELSTSGHPIQAEPGRGGGIRWLGGKQKIPFSESQMFAIQEAIKAVSPENKLVFEDMIRNSAITEVDKNDIFGIFTSGMTQRALASKLGITESHISRILSGQKTPSAGLAVRISACIKKE